MRGILGRGNGRQAEKNLLNHHESTIWGKKIAENAFDCYIQPIKNLPGLLPRPI